MPEYLGALDPNKSQFDSVTWFYVTASRSSPRYCVKNCFTHSPRPRVSSEENLFEFETSCFSNMFQSATTTFLHKILDSNLMSDILEGRGF